MSAAFPWYDSYWLTSYSNAEKFLRSHQPDKLQDFTAAFDVLRTDPTFQVKRVPEPLSEENHARLIEFIADHAPGYIEKHEVLRFGRTVVHDADICTDIQASLTDRMSDWVGEPVEPSYNFLSLYNNLGICGIHLDAPSAKWTFDYCIQQSRTWPIHIGRVRPWPEQWAQVDDWEVAVRSDPNNQFSSFAMQDREALVFSGSSQWHFRDRLLRRGENHFCHLLFLHFIPAGTRHLANPQSWAEHFAIPALADVVATQSWRDPGVIA